MASFQSSLELSPECNEAALAAILERNKVSILTRAFARVQLVCESSSRACRGVSILTRAFARVQQMCVIAVSPTGEVSILTRAFARVQRL